MWVFFDTTAGGEPDLTLVADDSSAAVSTTVEFLEGGEPYSEVRDKVAVVTPDSALQPHTTYRLEFAGLDVCGSDSPVQFTTGGDQAGGAPSFSGAMSGSSTWLAAPEQSNDCNDGSRFPRVRFEIEGEEAADAAAYALYHDGSRVTTSADLPAPVDMLPEEASDRECFILRAINLAGAIDENGKEVCVETAGDAGEDGGGCSTVPPTGSGLVVLVILIASRGRRRR